MSSEFSLTPFAARAVKPWGEEIIFTPPGLARTGKILRVSAGKRLSLQYHDAKEETMCLLSGEAVLELEDANGRLQAVPMVQHRGYTVRIGQKHRLAAVTEAWITEVSDPERGRTFRLADDYGRPHETETARLAARENLGGKTPP